MIDDTVIWGAIGAGVPLLMGVIGWTYTIERRLGNRLTRSEHSQICDKQRINTDLQLKAIANGVDQLTANLEKSETKLFNRIEQSDKAASSNRHRLNEAVNTLVLRMALIQKHLGIEVNESIWNDRNS